MPQYKLMFRGDQRGHKSPDSPFKQGFLARKLKGPGVQFKAGEIYLDFDSATAVCVTAEIASAVIFPQNSDALTWIYAMGVDITDPGTLNGHARRVVSHLNAKEKSPPIFWYAREWAVKTVPKEQVAPAILVNRTFPKGGGDPENFTIVEYARNPECPLPEKYMTLLVDYVEQLNSSGVNAVKISIDGFRIPERTGPGRKLASMNELIKLMKF